MVHCVLHVELKRLLRRQEALSRADTVWIGAEVNDFSDEKSSGVIDTPCGGFEVREDPDKMMT